MDIRNSQGQTPNEWLAEINGFVAMYEQAGIAPNDLANSLFEGQCAEWQAVQALARPPLTPRPV